MELYGRLAKAQSTLNWHRPRLEDLQAEMEAKGTLPPPSS